MNKHFRKVLRELKTREDIQALGFSRKELKGIAADLADKLTLKDDATEEEISEAVEEAIDAATPLLKMVQTVSDRRLQSYKNSQKKDDEGDDDDDDEPSPKEDKDGKKDQDKGDDKDSALLKTIGELTNSIKGLKDDISALKSGSLASSRKAKIEGLVKDTGKFGERVMRSFQRMSFETEDEFEDYLDEIREDLEQENQERANKGLERLGNPPTTDQKKDDKAPEVISDDDMKALAKL